MKKRTTAPTPIREMYLVKSHDVIDRVVCDLAEVIHEQAKTGRRVISWAAQVEAHAYVTEHGIDAAINRIVRASSFWNSVSPAPCATDRLS
jgi:hypothetical protein